MAIRRLYGTATFDAGIFWSDSVNHNGWRIQYNKTLEATKVLKPYRLLDPKGNLWASSDSLAEMAESLPELATVFSEKEPLFGSDEAKAFIKSVLTAVARVATAAAVESIKKK